MIWSLKRLETVSSPGGGVGGAHLHDHHLHDHQQEQEELIYIIIIIIIRRRRRRRCYRAALKQRKLPFHSAHQWSEAHMTQHQGSLACTDWDIFVVDSLKEWVELIMN